MGMYNIGEVIRRTRESLDIPQKLLCDGICSVETLSRIENGKQTPSRTTFQALMERMGRDGERYHPMIRSEDSEVMQERQRLVELSVRLQIKELDARLDEFEKKINMEDAINRQFVLRLRAYCDYFLGRIDRKERIEKLMEAIRCTVPEFDGKTIPKRIFHECERRLFCNIATSYMEEGEAELAQNLLRQLEEYVKESTLTGEKRSSLLGLLHSNIAQMKGRLGMTEEALELNEKEIQICLEDGTAMRLENLLYNAGFEMEILKVDENACKERMLQAYYVAEFFGDIERQNHIAQHCYERYGREIQF